MDLKTRAYALLILTLFSGALLPILLEIGRSSNIYEFFFVLYAISIPISLIFLAYRNKVSELVEVLRKPRRLALLCFMGIITYLPLEFGIAFAEKYVSASLATTIFRISPLLMLTLLPTVLREKLSRYQIIAISIAFVGLYIGISGGNPLGILQNSDIGIILFLIVMAFAYALSVVMIKRYVVDIGVLVAVASATMFAIFLLLFVAGGMKTQPLGVVQIGVLLYIGIFFNVFSFFMFLTALRPIKATIVSNIYSFSPFITFLLAYLVLGESIQPYYIVIALLAGVGIVIQGFDKYGGRYISTGDGNISRMTIFDVTGIFANTGEMAINSTIKGGGRILAVKLDNEHAERINDIISADPYGSIYTDSHESITDESRFVKDILGANKNEFVVMKAGRIEECEKFFEDLYGRITGK